MRLLGIVGWIFCAAMLAACGGNGDKVNTSGPTTSGQSNASISSNTAVSSLSRSSNNSSLSSSGAMVMTCASVEGAVFIDETCPKWQEPSVFEQQKINSNIYYEVPFGSDGALVSQKIIDSGDALHKKVWDIQYNNNNDFNGLPHFRAAAAFPDGVDMSAYATGKLIFDMKVIASPEANPDFTVHIECGWPCYSTDVRIPVNELNTWKTYELSVADLIRDGLKITNVAMGFQIIPRWWQQNNTHFQIDNIRWVKGATPVSTRKCFAQHFDRTDWTYTTKVETVDQMPLDSSQWIAGVGPLVTLIPQLGSVGGAWGFSVKDTETLGSCVAKGTISASIQLPSSYIDNSQMELGFYFIDKMGTYYIVGALPASQLKANEWNTISATIPPGKISNAEYMGVYFDSKVSNVADGYILLDNFVITHSLSQ